jgi:DNA-directed RNA polymerase subunit RPC12/RpoP
MALIKCVECGNEISSSATKCPKCGKTRATRERLTMWIIFVICFLITLFWLGNHYFHDIVGN